jgi:hypothetical protein
MRFLLGKDFRMRNPLIRHNSWVIELVDRNTAATSMGTDTRKTNEHHYLFMD